MNKNKVSNKQIDTDKLKRRVLIRKILFISLLLAGIITTIVGIVLSSVIVLIVGVLLLGSGIVISLLIGTKIIELEERIESYCPDCNNPTLVLANITNKDMGEIKTVRASGGLISTAKRKLIRETRHYKCSKCGYEHQSHSTNQID